MEPPFCTEQRITVGVPCTFFLWRHLSTAQSHFFGRCIGGEKPWPEYLDEMLAGAQLLPGTGEGSWHWHQGCAVGCIPYLIVASPGPAFSATLSFLLSSSQSISHWSRGLRSNAPWCQGYFNLGSRITVECFPFLKTNLNFGRGSSPAVVLWTGTCSYYGLSPPGCICVQPTFVNHWNKVWRLANKQANKQQHGSACYQMPLWWSQA